MRPSVNIGLSNGGLNIKGPSELGTSVVNIATPAAPTAGYGVPFLLRNKADVKAAFAAPANADVQRAFLEGFFGEAPEGTKVYVVCKAQVTTLAVLAAEESALNLAAGAARLVAIVKQPAVGYVPVITSGFDTDVHDAVTAAQTLANTWLGNKKPFRFFVQGFAYSGTAADAKDYRTTTNRNGHIVVGAVKTADAAGSMFATLLALGRAAAIQPQQNIGRVKSGSLNIDASYAVYIGAIAAGDVPASDLDGLYDKGYITWEKNQVASGFIWNDDNSLTSLEDDFNNLRNGRVIDNAVRVAFATYYQELKDDVEVDAGGRLAAVVEKALEAEIEVQIDQQLGGQLSKKQDGTTDVTCLVNPDPVLYAALYASNNIADPDFNVFSGGNVYIFVSLRPKGCLKQINVFIGFTA
jgi:hypothetical protein